MKNLLIGLVLIIGKSIMAQEKVSSNHLGTLTIEIKKFRNNSGKVMVTLFNNADAFPKASNKAIRSAAASIVDQKAEISFENIPPGEYAVSVFHDENGNQKMDSNFLGIPKEGVGASNDARGHFGPPKYQDAKFNFTGNQTIKINIVYL